MNGGLDQGDLIYTHIIYCSSIDDIYRSPWQHVVSTEGQSIERLISILVIFTLCGNSESPERPSSRRDDHVAPDTIMLCCLPTEFDSSVVSWYVSVLWQAHTLAQRPVQIHHLNLSADRYVI